jgi:aminoglycoside phosphotransferase (APT) family kinase protein
MALKNTIDPQRAAPALAAWLAAKLPGADDVRVSDVHVPHESGISAETAMFEAAWREQGTEVRKGLVARVQPITGGVFETCDLGPELMVLRALGEHTDVPVPAALWHERDESVLGAPFLVMERLHGRVPRDDPPFTVAGWVLELNADEQRTLHDNGLRALAAVHAADPHALGLDSLAATHMGGATLADQIASWQRFYAWSADGEPNPTVDAAFAWLHDHRPQDAGPTRISWGDARLGNMIFADDLSVAGILDWELATLGSPEIDLAWWLFILRHHTEGIGAPMPPGFPDAGETVRRYEELTGHRARHLDYYEVYAAMRLSVAMVRAARMMIAAGQLPPDSTMAVNNPASQLLAGMLGLATHAGPTQSFIGNR